MRPIFLWSPWTVFNFHWTSNGLNWLINVCLGLAAIINFGNELAKWRIFEICEKTSFKVASTVILFAIIAWASSKKDTVADADTQYQLDARDAYNRKLLTHSVDSISKDLAKTYTDALAKWGLKLDSQSTQIERRVSDSALNKNIPFLEAVLGKTDSLTVGNNSLTLQLAIANQGNAVAYNTSIVVTPLIKFSNIPINFPSALLVDNMSISSVGFGRPLTISYGALPYVDTVYFVLNGHYNNYYNSIRPIPTIKTCLALCISSHIVYKWVPESDPIIWSYIKKKGLLK